MNKIRKYLKVGLLLWVLLGLNVLANSKLEYEVALTEKAQKVLDTVLGEGKGIAAVSVSVDPAGWRLDFEEDKKSNNQQELLPGYKGVMGMSSSSLPSNGSVKATAATIKSINVTLFVDKRVGRKAVALLADNLSKVLNLYPERGDKITTEYQNFPKPMSEQEYSSLNEGASSSGSGAGMWVLVLTVMGFLGTYVLFQQKQLKAQAEMAKNAKSSGGGGGASSAGKSAAASTPKAMPSSSIDAAVSSYFKYINSQNILVVQTVLESNNWAIEDVAIVLSKLNPNIVNLYLKEKDREYQKQLVKTFFNQVETSFDVLESLDKKLKEQLDCSVGGERVIQPILFNMEQSEKEKLFVALKPEKAVFEGLRPLVFLFEDILKVKDGDLKRLLGELDFDDLGKVMTDLHDHISDSTDGSEGPIYEKMLNALPTTTRALIEQQVSMKAGKYDDIEIEIALQHFFELIKKERGEGHIHYEGEDSE